MTNAGQKNPQMYSGRTKFVSTLWVGLGLAVIASIVYTLNMKNILQ